MITRTFLDKTTTIKKETLENFGLNPISMIGYGVGVYRSLIHFDINNIKNLINENKTSGDTLSHHLIMKNCGSVDTHGFYAKSSSPDSPGVKERATSFTVILFEVNKHWDEGIGFDNQSDFWTTGKGAISEDGATWYNATTYELWDEDGIYDDEFLSSQYELYKNGTENTIIVGCQHFDHGNEDLDIDITEYVNNVLDGCENYGLCLAFIPDLEALDRKKTQYVGFFNNKTNTIYAPVVETRNTEYVCDDRMDFYLDKENKLYLYSYIGGKLRNLDVIPTCTIGDSMPQVYQAAKGIYYVNYHLTSSEAQKDMILYDVWSNLIYDGADLGEVELEFVTKAREGFFSISNEVLKPRVLNPIIVGINANEKLNRGEERVIKLYFKQPYTKSDFYLVDRCQYRIYVQDGDREVTIVDWDYINKMDKCNMFTIKSDEFVPAKYHVDIKAEFGDTIKVFKDELNFTIVSDASKQKL